MCSLYTYVCVNICDIIYISLIFFQSIVHPHIHSFVSQFRYCYFVFCQCFHSIACQMVSRITTHQVSFERTTFQHRNNLSLLPDTFILDVDLFVSSIFARKKKKTIYRGNSVWQNTLEWCRYDIYRKIRMRNHRQRKKRIKWDLLQNKKPLLNVTPHVWVSLIINFNKAGSQRSILTFPQDARVGWNPLVPALYKGG